MDSFLCKKNPSSSSPFSSIVYIAKLRPLKRTEIKEDKESVGLIFEMKLLQGTLTNSATSDIINVQKSSFEIGVKIDW